MTRCDSNRAISYTCPLKALKQTGDWNLQDWKMTDRKCRITPIQFHMGIYSANSLVIAIDGITVRHRRRFSSPAPSYYVYTNSNHYKSYYRQYCNAL